MFAIFEFFFFFCHNPQKGFPPKKSLLKNVLNFLLSYQESVNNLLLKLFLWAVW